MMTTAAGGQTDPVAAAQRAKDDFVSTYRIEGRIDPHILAAALPGLQREAASATGTNRTRALYELGSFQRMTNDFATAVATLTQAARGAADDQTPDLAFSAWMGVARANAYGTADHGAAARALEQAVRVAGRSPTPRQRYDLLYYGAELELGRGETEAALIDALEAQRIAPNDEDRFYAAMNVADALRKFADGCDYRPLIDARSFEPGEAPYDACQRAVVAGQAGYGQAGAIAAALGWRHLAAEMRGAQSRLALRGQMIAMRARGEAIVPDSVFSAQSVRDVVVSDDFAAGASQLVDQPMLATLVEQVAGEAEASGSATQARGAYLRGLVSDMRGGSPGASTEFYAAAASQLATERGGFFDARRRGTVLENRGEVLETLALRLLALGRQADAFATFESVRARGLADVADLLSRPDLSQADRLWFSRLVGLEAEASQLQIRIVRQVIAYGPSAETPPSLERLATLRARRAELLRENDGALGRFAGQVAPPVSLDAMRAVATRAGVPVIFYWCTYANTVAWVIGPRGSTVQTVFLPQHVLARKIDRLLAGMDTADAPVDDAAARELYLYLIAPFRPLLGDGQVMIVPQGPLTRLPFEALTNPDTGQPLIETWAVSYAPNATFAARALSPPPRGINRVDALVDPEIEVVTHERRDIARAVTVRDIGRDDLAEDPSGAAALHILHHGVFDPTEPLRSELRFPDDPDQPLRAADLLAVPLRGRPLVVLSACESGRTETRISNEIYGFPWAILAAGAEAAVLSRWRVNGDSNSRWMHDFYAAMAGGAAPSQAAATTMRRMRAAGQTHPYYWAAMQVTGR